MKYFVSRQCYWPDGDLVVEIAVGGIDYSNPDMLVERWPELGEGKEFSGCMNAVDAAITIRNEWAARGADCRIEAGYTHGYTMPFGEYPTDEQLREWAREEDSREKSRMG